VWRGKVGVSQAVARLRHLPYEDLGFAKVDHHRALRQGFPEVIMAREKRPGRSPASCAPCAGAERTFWSHESTPKTWRG